MVKAICNNVHFDKLLHSAYDYEAATTTSEIMWVREIKMFEAQLEARIEQNQSRF